MMARSIDILEFPHVARLVIVREGRHGFGGDVLSRRLPSCRA